MLTVRRPPPFAAAGVAISPKTRKLLKLDQTRSTELSTATPGLHSARPDEGLNLQVAAVALNPTAMLVNFEAHFLISGCP